MSSAVRQASNMLIQKPRAVQTESNRHSKIYMPPELCVLSDRFTGQTVRGAVRLPSVMHRLHCLLLASELKAHFGLSGVSPRKLLEALTARGSQEGYSYERHEFLGDAYLRYAVARSLFFNHFDASELRLAELLTNQVSNKELKKLAVEAGLPYYIVSEHFDVRAWEAPGLSAIPMREDKPIREQANVCPDRQCCDVRNEGFDLLSCHSSFCRSEQAISDKIIADVVEAIIGLLILERDDEDYAVKFMTSIGIEAGYVVQSLRLNPGELPVGDTCVLGIHEGNRSDLGAGATMKNSPWLTTDIKPKSPKDSLEDLKRPLIANPPASLNECSMAAPPQGFRELGASFLKLKERNNNMASEIGDEEMNKVESLIGYTFRRRYLLSKVLRHASCEEESVDGSYFEKLAHLGNAAIDYVLTWQLLINNPDRDPGTLNILRQAAVNNERYARMIIRCGLQKHFRVAHGGLKQRIAAFVRAVEEEESGRESEGADFPKHAFGHVTASAPKALSDLCGALAGAIILDCDFDANTLWQVYKPLASPLPEAGRTAIHPTAELVLLCQKNAWSIEARTNDCSDCGDHIVELWINGRVAAWAENSSYQTARRLASNEALKNLSEEGKPKDEVVDFCCKSAVNKQFTETDLPSREGEEGKLDRNRNVLQGGALGSQLFEDSCRVSREMFHDELPSKERAYDEGRDGKSKWWSQSRVLFGKPETRNAIFVCSETSINKHPAQKTEESKAPLLPGEDLIEEEDTEPAARTGQDSGVSWKEWEHTRGISHENVSTDIGSSLVNNATVRADNGDKAPSEGSDTGKFSDDCSYVLKTKGLSRQILVHLCTKNGWKLPTYKLLKEEGTQHCPLFVFCSHVAIQDEEISAAGTPMPSHAKAKDSAALSMLLKLEKLGLSWTCK